MMNSSTTSSTDLRSSLEVIEIKPGLRFTVPVLQNLLPDAETVLFFGKVFDLDYKQLSLVMSLVLQSDLAAELHRGDHSTDLQDYLVDDLDLPPGLSKGFITFNPTVPKGEILPELWKSMQVEVAQSIKDVATKLQSVVGLMPGKQGSMLFDSMAKLNLRRPTIGDYRAKVHHQPVKENLVILDVSGSMTAETIRKIVDDVVALSYTANAHMAVVSDSATHWEPGSFSTDDVLRSCEYRGTHYERLAPLLDAKDWGVVVSVADYDSSPSAGDSLRRNVNRRIEQVLDISLVNRPTFLAECIGQFADEVRPLLIAQTSSYRPLSA